MSVLLQAPGNIEPVTGASPGSSTETDILSLAANESVAWVTGVSIVNSHGSTAAVVTIFVKIDAGTSIPVWRGTVSAGTAEKNALDAVIALTQKDKSRKITATVSAATPDVRINVYHNRGSQSG